MEERRTRKLKRENYEGDGMSRKQVRSE